jgi:hypothetical protein
MTNVLMSLVSKIANIITRENFDDITPVSSGGMITLIIIFCIASLITCWIGQWLYNHVLVKTITIFKPITFPQFIGLYIVTHILFC